MDITLDISRRRQSGPVLDAGITGLDIAQRDLCRYAREAHGAAMAAFEGCWSPIWRIRLERDAGKIEFFTWRGSAQPRADPTRLMPMCAGRGRANALARHASHHRAGDRERILLRLLPQRAVHARGGDFAAIEKKMREIIARDMPFTKEAQRSRDEAEARLPEGQERAVQGGAAGRYFRSWPKGDQIKIYRQGDWFDLCRGPHMTSTGKIGSAFKLMKVAGAYWRGDSNREMLSRIYGTAFAKPEELDVYLKQIEEAEKRDHRRVGREMDLFHFQEEAPGSVFWHPGNRLDSVPGALESTTSSCRQAQAGYVEVNSPQLMDSQLWVATGHMAAYRDMMFLTEKREDDERQYAIKPMNCPGHVQILQERAQVRPGLAIFLKIAEFGKVHRFELPSGALHLLMRVRAFTCRTTRLCSSRRARIAEEALEILRSHPVDLLPGFRWFADVYIKFSADRPDKRIGRRCSMGQGGSRSDAGPGGLNGPGPSTRAYEGAFYGPKLEYGAARRHRPRTRQCGTGSGRPQHCAGRRSAPSHIDEHSDKVTPVMLHRAMFLARLEALHRHS